MSQRKLNIVKEWFESQSDMPTEVRDLLVKAMKDEQGRLDRAKQRKERAVAHKAKYGDKKVNQLAILADAIILEKRK
ncbi:hypothetical protein [Litchfieldia alkalitelluris]|uniref:hypothetical protein n=1 Tax=Litchfieldia alkalitelluris TaxID=304268 RepID=UPI0009976FCA|nr:hypothetical protein [Litchfieldia alkalitelluris]